MKALISAACIVIIASGSWYLFSELQRYRAHRELQTEADDSAAGPDLYTCYRATQDALANKAAADRHLLDDCDNHGLIDRETRQKLDYAGVF